jgi:hypothetical protein
VLLKELDSSRFLLGFLGGASWKSTRPVVGDSSGKITGARATLALTDEQDSRGFPRKADLGVSTSRSLDDRNSLSGQVCGQGLHFWQSHKGDRFLISSEIRMASWILNITRGVGVRPGLKRRLDRGSFSAEG